MKTNDRFLTTIRWIARISGLLIVAFTIFMAVGYFLEGRQRHPDAPFLSGLTPLVIVTFIVWSLGLVGLLLGWWKEKQGGLLSLACFILVFVLSLSSSEARARKSALLPMLAFSIPSLLFISCWRMASKTMPPGDDGESGGAP
jgi:hypothetical protein